MSKITAMTSGCYYDKSVFAVALVEEQLDIVSFEIFSSEDPEKMVSLTGRIKI